MAVDLKWLLDPPSLPEPEPAPFVPPIDRPGVSTADASLGCGLLSPLERDGRGDFKNGCGDDIIRSSVARILGVVSLTDSTHGELPWLPEFGSLTTRIRHASVSDGTADLARYYVIDALRIWEPRISVKDAAVSFVGVPGTVGTACEIRIVYNIIGQRRSTAATSENVSQVVTLNLPQAA
jgi:phage baseplate assembly protein W